MIPLEPAWLALLATIIGAALAFVASWITTTIQRKNARSDRFNTALAAVIESLYKLGEAATEARTAPGPESAERLDKLGFEVAAKVHIARLEAADRDQAVLDVLSGSVREATSGGWDEGNERSAAGLIARALVKWRRGHSTAEQTIDIIQRQSR